MAVIYIEKAGIRFSLENNKRIITIASKESLSGLVYTEKAGYKKYEGNIEQIAGKIYKDKSYIIDGNAVYYYNAAALENFKNVNLSSYQILINKFLEHKNFFGNILLIDGNKDAAAVSLIIDKEFKQIIVGNSNTINETTAEIKKYINKEKIKLDKIILGDEFYMPIFQKTEVNIIGETEILEFAQEFDAPIFQRIENIRKKLNEARGKKLNLFLFFAALIFMLSLGCLIYAGRIYKKYEVLNNSLNIRVLSLKQRLNLEIEKKFLSTVRINIPEKTKSVLLRINTVKNLKINSVAGSNNRIKITGTVSGGYRNFVKSYNLLKKITSDINCNLSYIVSSSGLASFIIRGGTR